jgi:carboxymethylenebutenolidase
LRPLAQFENYLVHEFVEDYQDGLMSRRDMMRRVLHITGSVAATATILTKLGLTPMTRSAAAQEATPTPVAVAQSPLSVAADDPRIIGEDITFPNGDATIMAYQARPSGTGGGTPVAEGPLPLVLICHENRGLQEHIRDVARRWAVQGYLATAVDLLSREGGTAAIADPAEIPSLLTGDVDPNRHVSDFQAAVAYYATQTIADMNRIGMIGFCFGGGITWRAVEQIAELKAGAPYYGPPPPLEDVPNIKAAVLGVYSDDPNDFANEGRDELEAALEAAGVTFEIKVYPGTQHAFHNDTGQRYNEEQAIAAWNDTLAWFSQYVLNAM